MLGDDFWDGFEKQARVGKFLTRGIKSLPKELQEGLREKAREGGAPDSLFMLPFVWGAKALKGSDKVDDFLWKTMHRPATSFDTAAGNVAKDTLGRIPGGKNLFNLKQRLPITRKGERLYKEFDRPSLTAPLVKGQRILAPFALGLGAEKVIRQSREGKKTTPGAITDTMQGV